jgi:CubicO group peptidase (beta-lactamase class C family)
MTLRSDLVRLAESGDFSGVIGVYRDGRPLVELTRGFADRANRRSVSLATVFGIASVTKGLTALTVVSAIESGELRADTTLRSLLPDALPGVAPEVTIEHLLAHTSGVWDYLDEDVLTDTDEYVLGMPVHRLTAPADYLPLLGEQPQVRPVDHGFKYNNGGYVMLAVAVEVACGRSYYDLVQERVLDPAGMTSTGFWRSDQLPPGVAIGYLDDGRSNVLHLPVRGAGDGGAFSTIADLERLWQALFAGRVLPPAVVERMVTARNAEPDGGSRYGLGFWLRADRETVMLEGSDAGISCRTAFDRESGISYTVISNTSSGAWPIVRHLGERLPDLAR